MQKKKTNNEAEEIVNLYIFNVKLYIDPGNLFQKCII
jgi:hypothetical protein